MISPRVLAASAVAGLATIAVGLAAAGPIVAIVGGVACALAVALLVQPALARLEGAATAGGEAVEAAAAARLAGYRDGMRLERAGLGSAVREVTDARSAALAAATAAAAGEGERADAAAARARADAERTAAAARLLGEATGRVGASGDAVGGAAERLVALLASSGRLDELAASVAELAGQLGIVSLNATIEEARRPAARAGRAAAAQATSTRTTGVLAQELRTLAERVTAASTQITEHAIALRDETRTVEASVGDARASLAAGEAALADAGEALGAVAAAVAGGAPAAGAAASNEATALDAALGRLRAAHAALEARLDA